MPGGQSGAEIHIIGAQHPTTGNWKVRFESLANIDQWISESALHPLAGSVALRFAEVALSQSEEHPEADRPKGVACRLRALRRAAARKGQGMPSARLREIAISNCPMSAIVLKSATRNLSRGIRSMSVGTHSSSNCRKR
jgi:hypothetical protein